MMKLKGRRIILADLSGYPRRFMSDYFVCESCGYGGYYKILGNTKTCPKCGGTMRRQ